MITKNASTFFSLQTYPAPYLLPTYYDHDHPLLSVTLSFALLHHRIKLSIAYSNHSTNFLVSIIASRFLHSYNILTAY